MTALEPMNATRGRERGRRDDVIDGEVLDVEEDFGRQPPHDERAEQAVLGSILLSKDALAEVVASLHPSGEDFYYPRHQMVFLAASDLYARGEPVDPVTVLAELERRGERKRVGDDYLISLLQMVNTAANAAYYAEIVAEKSSLRRVISAGTRIVQYGYAGADGTDVAEVIDRAQSEVYAITDRSATGDALSLEQLLQPTMDELDAIAAGKTGRGIPTGFTEFDEITHGLHPGQMITVAARPGVGKALALDTVLLTPDGKTTMGEVQPGDLLLDGHGNPTRVAAATEVMLGRPCYAVEFGDGTVIVADADHQWLTLVEVHGPRPKIRTTREIAASLSSRHWVPDYYRNRGRAATRIVDVRQVPSVAVRCVQVDNSAHMYLCGEAGIQTHNSTLAMDFARSAAIKHGMATAIFSLEMSRTDIVMRLLSAEARIKFDDMRAGRMSEADWARLARTMEEIAEAPLFIDDSANMTMLEIAAKARRMKQRNDLRLIIVDYLQLMTSGKRVESRQQEVSEFSRQLKLLAKELHVPVVALSQLNRGPEQRTDKRPMVSDLRESGSIEQDSDLVLLLHRPDMVNENERQGEVDLIIGKHRNGRTATVTLANRLHQAHFYNMARG